MSEITDLTESIASGNRTIVNPVRRKRSAGNSGGSPTVASAGSDSNDTGADSGGSGDGGRRTDGGATGADQPAAVSGNQHGIPEQPTILGSEPIGANLGTGNPDSGIGESVDAGRSGGSADEPTGRTADSVRGRSAETEGLETPKHPVAGVLKLSVPTIADPTKNKGGRPRTTGKPAAPAKATEEIPAEVCTYLLQWGFAVLQAARPWGMWHRTPAECQPAGEAMAQCLKKLPPKYAEKILDIMPIFALGMNLFALVAPSIGAEQEAYERAKNAATLPPPNVSGQGQGGFNTGNPNGIGNGFPVTTSRSNLPA